MHLGFYYHISAYYSENNDIITTGFLGVFIDSLAQRCEKLTCFFYEPVDRKSPLMDYKIQSNNVHLVSLGKKRNFVASSISNRSIIENIQSVVNQLDAFLLRGPSPLLPDLAELAFSLDVPVSLLLVGDLIGVNQSLKGNILKVTIIRLLNRYNLWRQNKVAQTSLVFVNSQKLYNYYQSKLNNLVLTRTTTLSENDFFIRQDVTLSHGIELLYTGRLSDAKGLKYLVESIAILTEDGLTINLNLVGWWDKEKTRLSLMDYATELGVKDKVIDHGFATVGEELFGYYRRSTIYVIASVSDFEGFPRTIWEAMANSCPVIATKVSSIPHFLQQETHALLIQPQDTSALTNAIRRLLTDTELRQKLILNGRQLAQQNTLEPRSKEMMDTIHAWLHQP